MNPDDLIKLIQDAIDNGATSVEQIHRALAAKPFDAVGKIGPIADKAEMAKNIHDALLENGYGMVRTANGKAGDLASMVLSTVLSKLGK